MIKKRPMTADGTSAERRKSRRFPVVVPIEVSWRAADGIAVKEDAVARQVNANGGFLKMSTYPELGTRITLANFLSAQTAEARVLAAAYARRSRERHHRGTDRPKRDVLGCGSTGQKNHRRTAKSGKAPAMRGHRSSSREGISRLGGLHSHGRRIASTATRVPVPRLGRRRTAFRSRSNFRANKACTASRVHRAK